MLKILDKSAVAVDPAQLEALKWTAKYVTQDEDDVVRYLCWDNLKKADEGAEQDHFALLVHTSVPYGIAHMDDQNDAIIATIAKSVRKLLPFLPQEQDLLLHRWR